MFRKLKIAAALLLGGTAFAWASFLFHVFQPTWSFDMVSDLHADAYLNSNAWEGTVTVLLASNKAWNDTLLVSPGDVFEQDNVNYPITGGGFVLPGILTTQYLTNDFARLQAGGIDVAPGPGNHDSDNDFAYNSAENKWDALLGTNFQSRNPHHYYFTNMAGSMTDAAWNVTNGASKFLFICLKWLDYTNDGGIGPLFPDQQTAKNANENHVLWARALAQSEPDHNVFIFCHWFANSNNTNTVPPQPPLIENLNGLGESLTASVQDLTNVVAVLCGHVKAPPWIQHDEIQTLAGNRVQVIRFNTQSESDATNQNGDMFVHFTVFPSEHKIHAQVFNSRLGRFMTNGETAVPSSFGMNTNNDWTFTYRQL